MFILFSVKDANFSVFADFDELLNFRVFLDGLVQRGDGLDGFNSTSIPSLNICLMADPYTLRSFSWRW